MAQTVLGGTVEFLAHLGIYDIVLPFLLVFTLMFAFLEKTKVLGIEIIKDPEGNEHRYTRKSLNAIVAFVTGFFVIASAQLVRIISEVLANVIIIIVAGVCFMLAIGITHTGEGELNLPKKWKVTFWIISFIAIVLIVLNALGWLNSLYTFLVQNWNATYVLTLIMVAVFVGIIIWVTGSPKPKEAKKKD